jgi:hypothetical protein
MIESWSRFRVAGPFASERDGIVVYRVKDRMSSDYLRDAAGQVMHYSPLGAAVSLAAELNRVDEAKLAEMFPERLERVSFA